MRNDRVKPNQLYKKVFKIKEEPTFYFSLRNRFLTSLETSKSYLKFLNQYIYRKNYLLCVIHYGDTNPTIKYINKEDKYLIHKERAYFILLEKAIDLTKGKMLEYHFDSVMPLEVKNKKFSTSPITPDILKRTLDVKLIREFKDTQGGVQNWIKIGGYVLIGAYVIYYLLDYFGVIGAVV